MGSETKRIDLFLNGKQVEGTIGNLRKKSRELNNEINQLAPGTKKYIAATKQLKGVNKRLAENREAVKGVNKGFSGIGGLVKKLGPVGLAIGVAATAAVAFGKKAVNAFRVQAKAIAKVEQAISSTGGAAGRSLKELEKQASSLQDNSLFGDEEILDGVTAQLLTFTNIAGEQFDRTQQAALDFSTVLGTDLKSSSLQLGKALNDPVAGLSALSRSGITFSESQKATIKSLTDTNQLAAAQNVILNELELQYGGQAKAAADADGGFTQLGNTFGDLAEDVGELLIPVISALANGLKTFVTFIRNIVAAFKEWDIDTLKASLVSYYDTITFGLIPGLGELQAELAETARRNKAIRESVNEATDAMNEQGKEFNTLIEVVKSSNTTDEQKAKAVQQLNEKYSEYTGEIDLTKASMEELNKVQKEANKQIVENAFARQAQIELEKLLQKQISKGQAIFTGNDGISGALADVTAKSFGKDVDAEREKRLEEFNKDSQLEVQGILDGLDKAKSTLLKSQENGNGIIQFGKSITIADEQIDKAKDKLITIGNDLESLVGKELADKIQRGGKSAKAAMSEALELGIDKSKLNDLARSLQVNVGIVNGAQSAQAKALRGVLSTGKIAATATAAQVKSAKKRADTLKKQLESLVKDVAKFNVEATNAAELQAAGSDEEKELIKLEQNLEKKFGKQIAAAEKLATKKGEVGIKAQEQLDALLLLKTTEFETSKSDIEQRYQKIRKDIRTQADKESADIRLKAEEASLKGRVLAASINAAAVSDAEINAQLPAIQELNEAKAELRDFEKQQALAAIQAQNDARNDQIEKQLSDEIITISDANNLKLDQELLYNEQRKALELQYKQEVDNIDQEFTEKQKERREGLNADLQNKSDSFFETLDTLSEIATNNELKRNQKQVDAKIRSLDAQLKSDIISEEEYATKKQEIEASSARTINRIKNQEAKIQRRSDTAQAIVNTALAVTKLLPTPPAALAAGIAGGFQVALIQSKELPQFKGGGSTKRVIGADDKKSYNANLLGRSKGGMLPQGPQLVLANEVGPEYFVPNDLLSHPIVADHVAMIEAVRTNKIRQFRNGGFTDDTQLSNSSQTANSSNDEMIAIMTASNQVMSELSTQLKNGIGVRIGDSQIDDITDKQSEIATIRG